MAEEKRTRELPIRTSAVATDRVILVSNTTTSNDASNTTQTVTLTLNNLLSNTSNLNITASTLIVNSSLGTPANSTVLTVQRGTMWNDNNYIYIATANNHVKRSALSDF